MGEMDNNLFIPNKNVPVENIIEQDVYKEETLIEIPVDQNNDE